MEYQHKDKIMLRTAKKEMTDEIKDMSVRLLKDISQDDVYILNSMGTNTIGELLQTTTAELYDRFAPNFSWKYWNLRLAVMEKGLLFNEDRLLYEQLGISEDVALIPLNSLNISNRLKSALIYRGRINYLGDLLTIDYDSFKKIRTFGEEGLIELKKYVHSLGFTLINEHPELNEIKEEYKKNGILMLQEELGLDSKISGKLYKNGIYTVQDLLNFGESVFELIGMGNLKNQKLREAMESKNVHFVKTDAFHQTEEQRYAAIMPDERVVERIKKENLAIMSRISRKEELSLEYDRLISERQELIAREQELNKEIAAKIEMLQDVEKKGEEITYGRR